MLSLFTSVSLNKHVYIAASFFTSKHYLLTFYFGRWEFSACSLPFHTSKHTDRHTHTQIYIYTDTHAGMHTNKHSHIYIHTYTYTNIHIHISTGMQHTNTYTCTQACIHTHNYIHIHTHRHVYSCIHTHHRTPGPCNSYVSLCLAQHSVFTRLRWCKCHSQLSHTDSCL